MANAVPAVIRNYNLFIDGRGFAGNVDEVTLPVLSIKTEDHRAGGMDMPVRIDLGMEVLDLKGQMAEHSKYMFRQFGMIDGRGVAATFRAAKADDTTVEPYVVVVRGCYKDLTPNAIRAGDKTPLTFNIYCRYYRLEQGGEKLIEIDSDNMVRWVGGVDHLATQRAAINFS